MSVRLQLAHTAHLTPAQLAAARALVDDVFADDITESDWEHALGGIHALLWEGERCVGHGSVVMRRMLHAGHALRTGYVEVVAIAADRRRRGYGGMIMDALEPLVRGGYELGALGASVAGAPLYEARGWERGRGELWALTPEGVVRTADEDGWVYVLREPGGVELDLDGALCCDWREGDVW